MQSLCDDRNSKYVSQVTFAWRYPDSIYARLRSRGLLHVHRTAGRPGSYTPPMETWVLPAMLGLGLAAAAGLRAFLPLLMLSAAVHFELLGVTLNESMRWLGSTGALVALSIATAVELTADLIPYVDNVLSVIGNVTGPIAGVIASWAAFGDLDPSTAAIAGLIIGAPTALAFSTAQTGTRAVSTASTGGLANPVVSVIEDVIAFVTSLIALILPLLVIPLLAFLAWFAWRGVQRVRRLRTS